MGRFTDLLFVYLVVALDNAVLASAVLPPSRKFKEVLSAFVLMSTLQIAQSVLIIGTEPLLRNPFFLLFSTAVLVWVSIQTTVAISWTPHRSSQLQIYVKSFLMILVGNLDDVLWLGAKIQGRIELTWLFALGTIPLAFFIQLQFAELFQRYRLLLIFVSLLTAYAASELLVQTPVYTKFLIGIPNWFLQTIFTILVIFVGVLLLLRRNVSFKS